MQFEYTPARVRQTRSGPRFRIGQVAERRDADVRDVTHLFDRTYDYASPQELRWHLAARLGADPRALVLTRRAA